MSDVSYVRTEMLPEQAAPVSEVGLVGWARQNLFSGVFNSVLTVLSTVFILWIIYSLMQWALSSSWSANSLSECREAIALAYGEGTHGACWAVIRERFLQLIYGFYPPEHYWRVNLTMVLMLVALAPVLFTNLSRKLLWFSAIYPALAFWLLWGGSIWGPISVMAGFVVGFLAFQVLTKSVSVLLGIIGGVLATVIWWLMLAGPVADAIHSVLPIGIEAVKSSDFGGFSLSVIIGVSAIAASFPIGVVLALGRQSNLFIVKAICVGFIEFIRGVPLITLLFVASTLLNYFMPPGTNFERTV